MDGSLFDRMFASLRPAYDAAFGQIWNVLPQNQANARSPSGPDPDRPVIEGLVGIFSDKVEMFKAAHVYDLQTDKRPGVVTSETRVEFPNALASGPIDLRGGDIVVRVADDSHWRITSIERDVVTNRLTCGIGRL